MYIKLPLCDTLLNIKIKIYKIKLVLISYSVFVGKKSSYLSFACKEKIIFFLLFTS